MDYLKFCKENIGRVVRIKWAYSFRDDEEHESLVRIWKPCTKHGVMADFGHPYDTAKKRCECGGMALNNEDIHALYLVNENEFLTWKRNYLKFHDAWEEAEGPGSDWCVEKGKMWY